jgi:predicted nucleic acid-binding protein
MTNRASGPRSALVDSSATLALADRDDKNHGAAVQIHTNLVAARARLYTTNFLIDETYTLILVRMGYRFAVQFLDEVRAGTVTIVRISVADEDLAEHVLRRYQDKRFSYTDATSFAVMERLRIQSAFTFDRNFAEYGRVLVLTP